MSYDEVIADVVRVVEGFGCAVMVLGALWAFVRFALDVVTRRGELISGISLTENFAMRVPGIAQLQIVQETVDHFVFRIVRGPLFTADTLQDLRGLVAERFGADATFDCDFVDRVPQEPSGKYRFCISKVENPFTRSARELARAA